MWLEVHRQQGFYVKNWLRLKRQKPGFVPRGSLTFEGPVGLCSSSLNEERKREAAPCQGPSTPGARSACLLIISELAIRPLFFSYNRMKFLVCFPGNS